MLMVTALGSGSGKTFIVTGIAGALKKRGYKVGAIKVGGDIRDIVPSLIPNQRTHETVFFD